MKKVLVVFLGIFLFVLGIVLSELILDSINQIFNKDIFVTKMRLKEGLAKCQQETEALNQKFDKKEKDLKNLIKEIGAKDYISLAKETLLTSAASTSEGKIFLRPPSAELLFKPMSSDDPSITELGTEFNNKIKAIIDASKAILREKINQLNLELLDMNEKLRDKNIDLNEKLKEVEQYKGEVEQQKKYIVELETIKQDLKKIVGDLEAKIEGNRLRVSFKGDILFSSGSHRLKKAGQKLLEAVYPVLEKSLVKSDIFIAGHTDNVPIKEEFRHKYESNWDLSTHRAIEVVKYLIEKGLNPNSLTAAGYGEFKPVIDNRTEEGRLKNRRVELFLIPKIIKRSDTQK